MIIGNNQTTILSFILNHKLEIRKIELPCDLSTPITYSYVMHTTKVQSIKINPNFHAM